MRLVPPSPGLLAGLLAGLLFTGAAPVRAQTWQFTDVTLPAGLNHQHKVALGGDPMARVIFGGVAAGDFDRDGWVDLYVVGGNLGTNKLFRNEGDGTFLDVAAGAGVAVAGELSSGPAFVDLDGDGWLDLFIGGIESTQPRIYRNNGNGTFTDVSPLAGITVTGNAFSANFGDHDRDGDLDLFLSRWGSLEGAPHLYRNDGGFSFYDADKDADLTVTGDGVLDYSFAGNFTDIDDDGWPDLLITSDFETSQIHRNDGDGTFTDITTPVIDDQNGMGTAVGDYDGDGDLDWFNSAIWNPLLEPGVLPGAEVGNTGNRLYRNDGGGVFADVTEAAGVRHGYWGWGASFADFDNDTNLDLIHVNGWVSNPFLDDPARLFMGDGLGAFTEESGARGIANTGQGRGIVCFDYDRDGHLDVFIMNNGQVPALYRNNGGSGNGSLIVHLDGAPPNTEGIGARVHVTVGGVSRMQELRCGSNFVSQNPAHAHFGLGGATGADQVRVEWPTGQVSVLGPVPAGTVTVTQPSTVAVPEEALLRARLAAWPNPLPRGASLRLAGPAGPAGDYGTVDIFDISGSRVRVLHGVEPGRWTWDGFSDAGHPVPAGVVFARLRGEQAAVKVILLD